jgi:hypothetical protein
MSAGVIGPGRLTPRWALINQAAGPGHTRRKTASGPIETFVPSFKPCL